MRTEIRKFYNYAIKGELKKLKTYINDVDVNVTDKFNRTALYLVIAKNYLSLQDKHLAVIDFLLESGANIEIKECRSECAPIDMAKLSTNNQILELFLKKKLVNDDLINELIIELSSINSDQAVEAHNFLVKDKYLHHDYSLLSTQPVYGDEKLRILKIKILLSHISYLSKKDLNKALDSAIEANNIKTAEVIIDFILLKNKNYDKTRSIKNNQYLFSYWESSRQKINHSQEENLLCNTDQNDCMPFNAENKKTFFLKKSDHFISEEKNSANLNSLVSICHSNSR